MAISHKPLSASFIFCLILLNEATTIAGLGVTVDLIHPDSPLSPLYNASETRFDRARKSLTLSLARYSYLKSVLSGESTMAFQAPDIESGGGYLMRIGIGTPPVKVWGVADTGSDLTWTQCQPCNQCFKQDYPLFYPRKSSTYQKLLCSSQQCQALGSRTGSCDSNDCAYQVTYGDGSFTRGSLATETLTFQSSASKDSVEFPKVVFGCGFRNSGSFNSKTSGIVGLGGGNVSIVKQLNQDVRGRFSYCLTLPGSTATSKISFGTDAVVSGESTPIVRKYPDTFYYITLVGISVGNNRLAFQSITPLQSSKHEGNMVIDSGTTLTYLPPEFDREFVSALDKSINGRRIDGPPGFNPCYERSRKLNVPPVTAHFKGADVSLPRETILIEVEPGVVCSTFVSSDRLGIAIFGNLHQVNYHVGYDLQAQKVSFQKTDCSKFK